MLPPKVVNTRLCPRMMLSSEKRPISPVPWVSTPAGRLADATGATVLPRVTPPAGASSEISPPKSDRMDELPYSVIDPLAVDPAGNRPAMAVRPRI